MPPDIMTQILVEDEDLPSDSEISQLRELCEKLVALQAVKTSLQDHLKETNKAIWDLEMREIPDLANEIGVDLVGLKNHDADIKISPYYKANISSDWPAERRSAAFAYLEEVGLGDLVRNEVRFVLGKDSEELVQAIIDAVARINVSGIPSPDVAKNVPWTTLTGAVREAAERGEVLDYEKIGATVGHRAQIMKRK